MTRRRPAPATVGVELRLRFLSEFTRRLRRGERRRRRASLSGTRRPQTAGTDVWRAEAWPALFGFVWRASARGAGAGALSRGRENSEQVFGDVSAITGL